MPRQAIKQATCTECDSQDDNYMLLDRDMSVEDNSMEYGVKCTCGERAVITVNEEGTSATSNVSLENASWNSEGEDNE